MRPAVASCARVLEREREQAWQGAVLEVGGDAALTSRSWPSSWSATFPRKRKKEEWWMLSWSCAALTR
jgi:hypothetical protein